MLHKWIKESLSENVLKKKFWKKINNNYVNSNQSELYCIHVYYKLYNYYAENINGKKSRIYKLRCVYVGALELR